MSTANDFHPFFKISGANHPFPEAVVSLWRMDPRGRLPRTFLYSGALIKPNCIFILDRFLRELHPLRTIGFYTGRSYLTSRTVEKSAIIDVHVIPAHQEFIILLVSTPA